MVLYLASVFVVPAISSPIYKASPAMDSMQVAKSAAPIAGLSKIETTAGELQ